MGGPGRAQDLNYLNYLIPGPELNNLNNLNIGGGGGPGRARVGGPGQNPYAKRQIASLVPIKNLEEIRLRKDESQAPSP